MNTKTILIFGGIVFLIYYFAFRKSIPYDQEDGFIGPPMPSASPKTFQKRSYSSTSKKR